jgi:hypothetical protein
VPHAKHSESWLKPTDRIVSLPLYEAIASSLHWKLGWEGWVLRMLNESRSEEAFFWWNPAILSMSTCEKSLVREPVLEVPYVLACPLMSLSNFPFR